MTGWGENIPLLHLVEALKGWDGDKDDNSLLAVANFNLLFDQSQHAISISLKWSAARPIPQLKRRHQIYSHIKSSPSRLYMRDVIFFLDISCNRCQRLGRFE